MTKSMCGPILEVASISHRFNQAWALGCLAFNAKVKKYIEKTKSIKYVVLASPFSQYVNPAAHIYSGGVTIKSNKGLVIEKFMSTLDWLERRGIQPVVFAPPPANGRNIGKCLGRSLWFGTKSAQCDVMPADHAKIGGDVIEFLEAVGGRYRVFWLSDFLCDRTKCRAQIGKTWIYRDGGHLSHEGSRFLGRALNFYGLITGRPDRSIK